MGAKAILDPADPAFISDEDRVNSPHNLLDAHRVFNPPPRESKRTLSFSKQQESNDDAAEKRVTIWNWKEQRKLSGNSAPFKKNLQEYIRKHPDWEEYVGQDKDTQTGKKLSPKKMLPPAPRDPNHPYYQMPRQGGQSGPPTCAPSSISMPNSAAPQQTSSYGTRSSQSRTREAIVPVSPSKTWTAPVTSNIPPDLSFPMPIILEAPAAVAMRRSLEMAARRKEMQEEGNTEAEQEEEDTVRVAKEAELAAWKAATAAVAAERAEKEAAQQKLVQEQ